MDTITREAANLLGLLLGREVGPDESVAMESDPVWDSMKHIEIIMAFEERFSISFEPEDIPELASRQALTDKVRDLTHGRPE